MKSGLHALTLVVFILAAFVCARGGEMSLYLDGEEITLSQGIIQQGGDLLVPLWEFGLQLGIQADLIEEEGSIRVRSTSGEQLFAIDHFPLYNDIYYIQLPELVALAGARMHTLGSDIYIESDTPHLNGIDASADKVSVRFDGFVPYEIIQENGKALRVRFYHCLLKTQPRQVSLQGSTIRSVALTKSGKHCADLVITIADDSALQIKRFATDGFYSVSIAFGRRPLTETEETISAYITYHEISTDLGEGPVKVNYLKIDEWRDHYRLVPAISGGGIGTLSSLRQVALEHGADAAIDANSFDTSTSVPLGLLIINGKVLSLGHARQAVLGIDLFGRLSFFNEQASLFLRSGDTTIAIDDVDKPIGDGEVVMITSGYSGPLTRGFIDSFRVVKIKEDRVTSVQEGPYVITDPQADLLIASGDAGSRISSLHVGDEVSYGFTLDQGNLLITDAVSAGPLLYLNGNDVLDRQEEGFDTEPYPASSLAARSLLATDWYGALVMLTVEKSEQSVGTDLSGLIELLHQLPIRVKSAIALGGGNACSLVFNDGTTYRETSSGGKVAVGLLLVPTDR